MLNKHFNKAYESATKPTKKNVCYKTLSWACLAAKQRTFPSPVFCIEPFISDFQQKLSKNGLLLKTKFSFLQEIKTAYAVKILFAYFPNETLTLAWAG